jgi:hypothetical protein
LVVEALGGLDRAVTRAGLLAAIKERGTFDLGGITLTYGPNNNQGMDRVFLTVIHADGNIQPVIDHRIDAAKAPSAERSTFRACLRLTSSIENLARKRSPPERRPRAMSSV